MSIVEKFVTMEYGPALEDSREALVWLDRHDRRFMHFIGGTWEAPAEGGYFDANDPSIGEPVAAVAQGSAKDVDAAVKAARTALPEWQSLSAHARARYLYALARQIQKHSRRLAVLETMNNGKSIRESRDPRHSPCRAPFLLPCWLGATPSARVPMAIPLAVSLAKSSLGTFLS